MNKWILIFSFIAAVSCQTSDDLFIIQQEPIDISKINRVLFLGNSITKAPPSQKYGWLGNWGMAASSIDNDYSHLLRQRIVNLNPSCKFLISNAGGLIEKEYRNLDISQFQKEINFAPDLIIMNIGENIDEETLDIQAFQTGLSNLLAALRPNNSTYVVIAGSFWSKTNVDTSIAEVCNKFGYGFVILRDLSYSKTNMALDQYENINVAVHPNDIGMEKIANRIWTTISWEDKN